MSGSRYLKSEKMLKRAQKVIPLGSQTFSKSITQYPPGISPLYITKGKGVQDIVFLIIESIDFKLEHFVKEFYYQKVKHLFTEEEFEIDYIISMCYYPIYVAIWFGTLHQDELIDVNFPKRFISKLLLILQNKDIISTINSIK